MSQKGVNLGGWLVLERWMTPSLFADSNALDELSLAATDPSYASRIKQHYKKFITRKDLAALKEQGVTQLRVPVGYWLFGGHSSLISGQTYLDQLFDWATEFDMQIILSIHAAPGSQNGKHHSGKIGESKWYRHINELSDFTLQLVHHYSRYKNFAGLGLLNEPNPSRMNIVRLIRYYRRITRRIRRANPSLPLYIDGTYRPWFWAIIARFSHVGLDLHLYHGFGKGTDTQLALQRLKHMQLFIKKVRKQPIIIGEWSGIIDQQPDKKATEHYIEQQRNAYQPARADFYWTYKVESGGYWNLPQRK